MKEVDRKVKCKSCGVLRRKRSYLKEDLEAGNYVCYICRKKYSLGIRLQKTKCLPKQQIKRKCLKCDMDFISVNNNRLCNACKSSDSFRHISDFEN